MGNSQRYGGKWAQKRILDLAIDGVPTLCINIWPESSQKERKVSNLTSKGFRVASSLFEVKAPGRVL